MQQHRIDVAGEGQVLTFPGEYPGKTVVVCQDATSAQDGVCRQYLVRGETVNGPTLATLTFRRGAEALQGIQSQQVGDEGCYVEDVLKIVMHHLSGLQNSTQANNHQAHALVKVEEAMHWMTKQRYVAEPAPSVRP